jgi:hypothetical protein
MVMSQYSSAFYSLLEQCVCKNSRISCGGSGGEFGCSGSRSPACSAWWQQQQQQQQQHWRSGALDTLVLILATCSAVAAVQPCWIDQTCQGMPSRPGPAIWYKLAQQ